MPPELLTALHQAEQSEPSVKAAALLRIARVLTKFDQAEAERVLDRGLALFAELPEKERAAIAAQVRSLAACVAPDRAFALLATTTTDGFGIQKFLVDMVRHGHVTPAAAYLAEWSEDEQFPYQEASYVLSYAKDDEVRREVLRSALRAWRRSTDRAWHSIHSLLQVLRHYWRLLPADEARAEIAYVVGVIRDQPDGRIGGGFSGPRGAVKFSSQHAQLLFELLGPLTQLDPELADVVTGENPELARAAALYPLGHDTPSDQPVRHPSADEHEQWLREWTGFVLGQRFYRIDDEKRSDYKDSFAYALRSFARDADRKRPNLEPRECWPSADDFRTILYGVGKHDPDSGVRLVDRIPDPALRLFAQIEFAAGVAGLEQIGGITRESRASRWPWAMA